MNPNTPNRKITAVGLAGSATAILIWALGPVLPVIPPEVASAFTAVIAAVIGYLVPEPK